MVTATQLRTGLEDVLAELHHARRSGDLGRLAVLSYCDLKRWARIAGHESLARRSWELIFNCPHATHDDFLSAADTLIQDAEFALCSYDCAEAPAR
jgi:hypothetical protein